MRWLLMCGVVLLVACVSIAATTSDEVITKVDDSTVELRVTKTETKIEKTNLTIADMKFQRADELRRKVRDQALCATNETMHDNKMAIWDARILQAEGVLGR